jgi:hypothetical protein
MKKSLLFLIIIVTISSCATILNLKNTTVKISADKASKIIFKKDTIAIGREQVIIRPERSKKPLKLTILKDSLQQYFFLTEKYLLLIT